MIDFITVLYYSVLGAIVGVALSWLPGFHIYNVIAVLFIVMGFESFIPAEFIPFFMLSAIIAFSFVNLLPAIFLSVADDTLIFLLFPSQRALLLGKGYRAMLLSLLGALGGAILLFALSPVLAIILPIVYNLTSNYIHVFIAALILFMFMSEWHRYGEKVGSPLSRLLDAWKQSFAGLFVFFASGILGFIAMRRPIVPPDRAYLNLMPLFIGAFGMAWVVFNLISNVQIPKQEIMDKVEISLPNYLRGLVSGVFGGIIAALYPLITGGMGALVAGHLVNPTSEDEFLISQGANRVVYYVGAYFLLFMPTFRIIRGTGAWITAGIYIPKLYEEYVLALGILLFVSGISFLATLLIGRVYVSLVTRISYKKLSLITMAMLVIITYVGTGLMGIFYMTIATFLGLVAGLYNTRRSYPLGLLLFPVLLSMTGTADILCEILGI